MKNTQVSIFQIFNTRPTLICCSDQALGQLASVLGGQIMTNIDLHCSRPPGKVNLLPARSSGFVPGDLTKASVVPIAYCGPMTSIVQQFWPPQNPLNKNIYLASNPAWWEVQIDITQFSQFSFWKNTDLSTDLTIAECPFQKGKTWPLKRLSWGWNWRWSHGEASVLETWGRWI